MKQIQIIGNLGRDAKLISSNGDEFISFSVAVNDDYTNMNGDRVERTDWFSVTTRKKNILQYLTKGTKVFIQGAPRSKPFQKEDGSVIVDTTISASWIQLLSSSTGSEPATVPQSGTNPDPQGINQDIIAEMAENSDLPF